MRPWRYSPRKAFTLVEVVASLMLVGTLLVTIMMAHRRAARQTLLAQHRIAAIEALDGLLSGDVDPLVEHRGKVPGTNPFYWQTTMRSDSAAQQLGAVIVKVEIFRQQTGKQTDERALASVELIQPGGVFYGRP